MIKRKHKLFLFLLIWVLLLSYLCTSLILYRQNTLYNNGNWNSTKMNLGKGVMGTFTYYLTRNALAKNHLNLGAWHGYHELIYKNPVNPKSVEFDFYMKEPSEFSFIFNKDEEGYAGIRINIHEKPDRTEFFISNSKGEFTNRTSIDIHNLRYNHWNNFKIEFQEEKFVLYINDFEITEHKLEIKNSQYVGFKGGRNTVLLDNIKIKGDSIIREDFSNTKGFLRMFLTIFIPFLLILLYFLNLSKPRLIYSFFLVVFVFLIVFSGFYFYEYYYVSERYIESENTVNWRGYEGNIESEDRILQRIEKYTEKNIPRILFIGTSQTWGAGASTDDKTFVGVFERLLNKESENYECINTGISGLISERAFYHYNSSWISLEPDIVIINLGTNDDFLEIYFKNLERFVILNNKENIETVFILEPNSYLNSEHIVEQHPVMREVSDKYNITMIDMHSYLLERYDTGFLWWDFVHLTDYGQQLFAEKLYRELTMEKIL